MKKGYGFSALYVVLTVLLILRILAERLFGYSLGEQNVLLELLLNVVILAVIFITLISTRKKKLPMDDASFDEDARKEFKIKRISFVVFLLTLVVCRHWWI